MLPLGLTLLTLAALLLIFSFRGRTTARGLFCRRCRFDLQGLDLAANPTCPECGNGLTAAKSRRTTLRRASRPGLVIATILLLAGASVLALRAPNAAAAVVRRLPDAKVFLLADRGVESAREELAGRLVRVPPIRPGLWDRMIDRTLDRQADLAQPWDARWGDLLAEALATDRMSDDDIRRYITNGLPITMDIRDRLRHGDKSMAISLTTAQNRIYADVGQQWRLGTAIEVTMNYTDSGLVSSDAEPRPGGATMNGLYLPTGPSGSIPIGGISGLSLHAADWETIKPGDQIRVYKEYQITLKRHADGKEWVLDPVRLERTVTVVDPATPIIGTIRDEPAVAQTIDGATAAAIRLDPPAMDNPGVQWIFPAHLDIAFEQLAHHVSGRLFLKVGTTETEIATLTAGPGMSPRILPTINDDQDRESGRDLLAALLARGHADLVFRSDPEVAEVYPHIDAVLDADMIFPRLPVLAPTIIAGEPEWPRYDNLLRTRAVPLDQPDEAGPSTP